MNIVWVAGMAPVRRIAPPLVVTRVELDRALAIMDQELSEMY